MAAVTICSDFGVQKNKVWQLPLSPPSISYEVMVPDAMILVFWMLSFKPTFSLSSFNMEYYISAKHPCSHIFPNTSDYFLRFFFLEELLGLEVFMYLWFLYILPNGLPCPMDKLYPLHPLLLYKRSFFPFIFTDSWFYPATSQVEQWYKEPCFVFFLIS